MRYILNSSGYLQEVSFGATIQCGGVSCKEYTGSVPSGYSSLANWFTKEGDKLYRWKIVNGQLTLDSSVAVLSEPSGELYAPAGYGLGKRVTNATVQTLADANDGTLTGWYRIDANTQNGIGYVATLRVVAYSETNVVQTAYQHNRTDTLQIRRRSCLYGTWGEWEWVDPPMFAGTEYRTTERWHGRPVYKKLLTWTSSSAMTYVGRYEIPHGISNLDSATLRVDWTTEEWTLPHVSGSESLYVSGVDAAQNSTKLIIKTDGNANWSAGRTFYFYLTYCKT